jgi:hypothetical protein
MLMPEKNKALPGLDKIFHSLNYLNGALKKSLLDRPFKNSKCKEQKKFKVDAYF